MKWALKTMLERDLDGSAGLVKNTISKWSAFSHLSHSSCRNNCCKKWHFNRIMSVEDTEYICCLLRDHYISEFRLFCEKLIKIWPKNIQNEISVMDSPPCACLPLVLIQQHLLLNNILFHHRIKLTSSTTNKLLNRHGSTKCCRLLQNIYRLQKSTDSSSWEICWNLITAGECSKRTIGHDHCI